MYLVNLDEQIGVLERECRATNFDPEYALSTKTLDSLFLEIDERLKDFGKSGTRSWLGFH